MGVGRLLTYLGGDTIAILWTGPISTMARIVRERKGHRNRGRNLTVVSTDDCGRKNHIAYDLPFPACPLFLSSSKTLSFPAMFPALVFIIFGVCRNEFVAGLNMFGK